MRIGLKFPVLTMWTMLLCGGCANTDKVLRPEHTTYIPQTSVIQTVKVGGAPLQMQCLEWDGNKSTQSNDTQCLYHSIDEQHVFDTFGAIESDNIAAVRRDAFTSFLMNISEKNCSTFLGRAFANKSSFDTGKGVFQDILTGSSAAAANAAPQAAAGLGLTNLLIGKSVDNINATFYFEKTFQALAAAIKVMRDDVKATEITPNRARPYSEYTIYDALAGVRKYDDACSIRLGLAKLQALANESERDKADILAKQRQLDSQRSENSKLQESLKDSVAAVAAAHKVLESSNEKIRKISEQLAASGTSATEAKRIRRELGDVLAQRESEARPWKALAAKFSRLEASTNGEH